MAMFLVFIGCGYAYFGSEKEEGLQEKAYEGMHDFFLIIKYWKTKFNISYDFAQQ